MTRVQVLLAALAAVLIVVLFWFLVWQPGQEEREDLEQQIAAVQVQQQELTAERGQLREVRERAPEIDAEIATANRIIPTFADVPGVLRLLQSAADDSGVVLRVVQPTRPQQLDLAPAGLSFIGLSLQLEGSYFQIIDFLRRIEDPTMTARGIRWEGATLTRNDDEYPVLEIALTGSLFSQLPVPPEEPEPEPDEDADTDAEDVEDDLLDDETDGEAS
jgi:type IV pilus assembly protein PilO